MTRTLTTAALRIIATGTLVAGLVAGVPWLLVRFVGNPLPTASLSWDEITLSVRSGQVAEFVVGVLAVVVWVVWAQLMTSFAIEATAAARGVPRSAVRGLGATQWLARRLVAQFAVASTVMVQTTAGLGLPAAPALGDVVPAVIELDPYPTLAESAPERSSGSGVLVEVDTSDTLWDLAAHHLGSGYRWAAIRDANVGRTMPDGTILPAGFVTIDGPWTLTIPTLTPESTANANPIESANVTELEIATTAGESGEPTGVESPVIGAWRVEPGDHFWAMADEVLTHGWGRAPSEDEIRSYWVDLIAANRDHLMSPGDDPNVIYADQHFDIILPPLPSDPMGADDQVATTTPHPLDDLDQFQPAWPPPPTHRTNPTTSPAPTTGAGEGPVVELDRSPDQPTLGETTGSTPATPRPLETTETEPEPATSGSGALVDGVAGTESPAETEQEVERDSRGDLGVDPDEGRAPWAVAAGVMTATGAAMFLTLLRVARHRQAARRRPGGVLDLPDDDHLELEATIRSIADHDAVRWLAATNQFLTRTLAEDPDPGVPAVVAARAGAMGVEVLLDDDHPPPQGFIAGDQPRSWNLHPGFDLDDLETAAEAHLPFAPLLLPVGATSAGDLLLDLGQLAVVGLDGPAPAVVGWLRSIAVAVASSPWSDVARVVAIGVDPLLARMTQVEVPDDPVEWATAETNWWQGLGPRPHSSYQQRLDNTPVEEVLVLIGPGHEGVAQHLATVAELANTPVTVAAAAPMPGDTRIVFDGERATIEPYGIAFGPSVMTAEAIAMTTTLLDQAADTTSVPHHVLYGTTNDDPPPPPDHDITDIPSDHTAAASVDPDPGIHDTEHEEPSDDQTPCTEHGIGDAPTLGDDSEPGDQGPDCDHVGPDLHPDSADGPLMNDVATNNGRGDERADTGDLFASGVAPTGPADDQADSAVAAEDEPEARPLVGEASEGSGDEHARGQDAVDPLAVPGDQVVLSTLWPLDDDQATDRPTQPTFATNGTGQEPAERTADRDADAAEPLPEGDGASTGDEGDPVPVHSPGEGGGPGRQLVLGSDPDLATVDVVLGEDPEITAAIEAIVAPRPVEVRVLHPTPGVEGTTERLTPKNVAVLGFLAFHRSVPVDKLREVFWPSSVNKSTTHNAISVIRRQVGRDADDAPRLQLAVDGRFAISDEVGCDWTRFVTLTTEATNARRSQDPVGEMAWLQAALELVQGPIGSGVDTRNWLWLTDDPVIYSRVETAIVDAAYRLGTLACEANLAELAHWAAAKGLSVVAEQEALYRIQMSAAALAGDESLVMSVFRRARRSAEDNGYGDGIQPETEALYRRLVGHRTGVAGDGTA